MFHIHVSKHVADDIVFIFEALNVVPSISSEFNFPNLIEPSEFKSVAGIYL